MWIKKVPGETMERTQHYKSQITDGVLTLSSCNGRFKLTCAHTVFMPDDDEFIKDMTIEIPVFPYLKSKLLRRSFNYDGYKIAPCGCCVKRGRHYWCYKHFDKQTNAERAINDGYENGEISLHEAANIPFVYHINLAQRRRELMCLIAKRTDELIVSMNV